jgi:hypothetical protein
MASRSTVKNVKKRKINDKPYVPVKDKYRKWNISSFTR